MVAGKSTERLDDEAALEALYALEVVGQTDAVRKLGYTVGRLSGLRKRCLTDPARRHPCACVRPENRDGGMPLRWWSDEGASS